MAEWGKYMIPGGTAPVHIRGLAKYSKMDAYDQYGKHSIRIYPKQECMNDVHKLISEGIKNKLTKDDDGYSITFSRPKSIKTKTKGEVLLEPVFVVDENNVVLTDRRIPDGTDITITLETYGGRSPTGFGSYKAARLQKVMLHGRQNPPF